jgi:glycosyltransferase involved in cell wall biosynthesis
MQSECLLSVVIPTYRRGQVVLDTVGRLTAQLRPDIEVLVVDQTEQHPPEVESALERLSDRGEIAWHRRAKPSIPAAMNFGLLSARGRAVLFLDDDIIPDASLVQRHIEGQADAALVAGQVLQPGQVTETPVAGDPFRFNSSRPDWIEEFMGGNFSVDRMKAIDLGGFDENFVGAAYRFEAEFAHRFVQKYGPIRYEPRALVHHLALSTGGTRAQAHHLRTARPDHSVGAYYFLLKTRRRGWFRQVAWRPLRAIRTRHHLRRPWWIPATLIAELRGLLLALRKLQGGARLIPRTSDDLRKE